VGARREGKRRERAKKVEANKNLTRGPFCEGSLSRRSQGTRGNGSFAAGRTPSKMYCLLGGKRPRWKMRVECGRWEKLPNADRDHLPHPRDFFSLLSIKLD